MRERDVLAQIEAETGRARGEQSHRDACHAAWKIARAALGDRTDGSLREDAT